MSNSLFEHIHLSTVQERPGYVMGNFVSQNVWGTKNCPGLTRICPGVSLFGHFFTISGHISAIPRPFYDHISTNFAILNL